MLDTAKNYAIACHTDTNHLYDGHPYSLHLHMVVKVAEKYIHLVGNDDIILSACWCHDLIEDCRQTYNDVRKNTSEEVAEIVYALTNEKGKNRSQRANEKYYRGIIATPGALFVKLCDRLANIKYSSYSKSGMLKMYQSERKEFSHALYHPYYQDVYAEMDKLLLSTQNTPPHYE